MKIVRHPLLKWLKPLFPVTFAKFRFYSDLGYWPNFITPRSFNEKVNHRKFYDNNPLYSVCANKLSVRKYVAEKVGEQYLVPLLYQEGCFDVDVIRGLGDNIVIKTSHDSGTVRVIRKFSEINLGELQRYLRKRLQRDFGKLKNEPWYSLGEPRVLVERLLVDENGSIPDDYKIHVFHNDGKFKLITQLERDRYGMHQRGFFDEGFTILPYMRKGVEDLKQVQRPRNFSGMLDIAKNLGADFDYVRVDLYNLNGRIYFGELTFAPAGGFGAFESIDQDFEWGGFWSV